jgi:hypothetical protein
MKGFEGQNLAEENTPVFEAGADNDLKKIQEAVKAQIENSNKSPVAKGVSDSLLDQALLNVSDFFAPLAERLGCRVDDVAILTLGGGCLITAASLALMGGEINTGICSLLYEGSAYEPNYVQHVPKVALGIANVFLGGGLALGRVNKRIHDELEKN